MRRLSLITIAICAAATLAACGSASAPAPERTHVNRSPATPLDTVTISGYAFHPVSLTVRAGTHVTFINRDATAHTATASGGGPAFDTGTVRAGRQATVTLTTPGTYVYYCQFHPFMRATIRVTP